LGGPWDAPREFRTRYAEADDPDPPESAEVPCRILEDDYDPDLLLGISQSYAGQVSLLDVCVGAFSEFLHEREAGRQTVLALLSARGFPMGEHRRIGAYDRSLYGELVHVPMMIRFPDRLGEAVRSQALVQPGDLGSTLLDFLGLAEPPRRQPSASLLPLVREEVDSIRDRLGVVDSEDQWAIRTPAWYLREAAVAELFAKPDDRWEVNDVADRCDDVAGLLRKAFAEYRESFGSGDVGGLDPLDEVLMSGLE
jgi:arylsulfatase A-like enzyme